MSCGWVVPETLFSFGRFQRSPDLPSPATHPNKQTLTSRKKQILIKTFLKDLSVENNRLTFDRYIPCSETNVARFGKGLGMENLLV